MVSHETLTMWVEGLTVGLPILGTVGGFAFRGWLRAWELERKAERTSIDTANEALKAKLEESDRQVKAQWQKVDALGEKASNFVRRDYLDEAIKGLSDSQSKAIGELSINLTNAINHLSDRLDRMVTGR